MTQRELIVSIAQSYIGCKESDGSHKKIIDIYNNHKPLAQGYTVSYTDPWCSTFASAVAIKAGLTDIIPTECGCERHVNLFKSHSKSRWEEDGTYIPSPGDYCFYNWDDKTQPNDGAADHVGIVEKIVGTTIYVIEGNYSDSVGRRPLTIGNGYIRGYGIPAYEEDDVDITTLILEEGDGGAPVKELQTLLINKGYSCGSAGADGDFGSGTLSAVKKFQQANGLTVDGVVGPATWAALTSTTITTSTTTTTEPTVKGNDKMKYNSTNKPLICMMTNSTCYKSTYTMSVKGILWHSTGANNPNLKRYVQPSTNDANYSTLISKLGKNGNANSWNEISVQAGLNAWVGKLADGTVASVQTMPWDYRPWGCGSGSKGSCNNGWIQFEICEDNLSNENYFNQVYEEACHLTAYLCDMYGIDPKGTVNLNGVSVPTILCHADSYNLGLGSNHGDVYHWFNKYGKDMDDVRAEVAALLKETSTTSTTTTTTTKVSLYRVRAEWDKPLTQKGAFGKLENAIACCDRVGDGYYVFDSEGNIIYPKVEKTESNSTSTITIVENSIPSKVGDEFSLIAGATYTSGKTIPNWLFRTKLYIREIRNNNIVFSTLKTGNITGIVNKQYIKAYDVNNSSSSDTVKTTLEVGDSARLSSGATYINGKAIPDWIISLVVYVREIRSNGDIVFSRLKTGPVTGVVNAKFLTPCNIEQLSALYKIKINVATLNVRESPGISYPVITQVKKDAEYTINEVEGTWGYIGELGGWVSLQYTKKV